MNKTLIYLSFLIALTSGCDNSSSSTKVKSDFVRLNIDSTFDFEYLGSEEPATFSQENTYNIVSNALKITTNELAISQAYLYLEVFNQNKYLNLKCFSNYSYSPKVFQNPTYSLSLDMNECHGNNFVLKDHFLSGNVSFDYFLDTKYKQVKNPLNGKPIFLNNDNYYSKFLVKNAILRNHDFILKNAEILSVLEFDGGNLYSPNINDLPSRSEETTLKERAAMFNNLVNNLNEKHSIRTSPLADKSGIYLKTSNNKYMKRHANGNASPSSENIGFINGFAYKFINDSSEFEKKYRTYFEAGLEEELTALINEFNVKDGFNLYKLYDPVHGYYRLKAEGLVMCDELEGKFKSGTLNLISDNKDKITVQFNDCLTDPTITANYL